MSENTAASRSSAGAPSAPPKHAIHRYLLQHPSVLRRVTRWRHFYFTSVRRRRVLRQFASDQRPADDPLHRTLEYNLSRITSFDNRRSFRMVKLVSCISAVNRNGQVLFVGPRTEADLLTLYAFGFAWRNLRGLDLFSYSPKIDVGDMHEMPYDDDSFDIAFSSWALTYSHDPRRACSELVRVTRPGGVICVGCEYDCDAAQQVRRDAGSGVLLNSWFETLEELKASFGAAVGTVLWQEQAPNIWMPGRKENLTLVFRVAKSAAKAIRPSARAVVALTEPACADEAVVSDAAC